MEELRRKGWAPLRGPKQKEIVRHRHLLRFIRDLRSLNVQDSEAGAVYWKGVEHWSEASVSIRTERDSFPVGDWFLQVHSQYREGKRRVSFDRGEEEVARVVLSKISLAGNESS